MRCFALAVTASAQTKISGKAHCAKADPSYSIDVGDKPGHVMILQKATCTYTTPLDIEGGKAKDETDVVTTDVSGESGRDSGWGTITMDSGNKFVVRISGTSKMNKDHTGTLDGKWSFVSGTGKLKGIKGGGTYKGAAAADGTIDFDVEGDYTSAAPKAAAKKSP